MHCSAAAPLNTLTTAVDRKHDHPRDISLQSPLLLSCPICVDRRVSHSSPMQTTISAARCLNTAVCWLTSPSTANSAPRFVTIAKSVCASDIGKDVWCGSNVPAVVGSDRHPRRSSSCSTEVPPLRQPRRVQLSISSESSIPIRSARSTSNLSSFAQPAPKPSETQVARISWRKETRKTRFLASFLLSNISCSVRQV